MIDNQSLQFLFKTFEKYPLDQIGLNIYAIADAAQDKKFLKVLEHLRQKCLLKEASGEKAKEISPHLIQLPKNFTSLEWEWIESNVAGTTKMTIIITPLTFDYLYKHLRNFLDIEFDGGLEMMLAFWDPAILATLVGHKADKTLYVQGSVFNPQQIEALLKPIQSWWYWDRLSNLQSIFGLNERVEVLPPIEKPLHFTVEQEEMMVEATFPDNLIYYLKLNNSFLVDKIDDKSLYEFVIKSIPEARDYCLSGTRDILNFICLKLMYGVQFESDHKLQYLLNNLKDKKLTMDQIMNSLMSEAG
ncbi:DUF4123 domain-containing protein [Acinetobacter pittii]|uniref:DUF4123 domain-containing protein n=1 Tax=Acinetobacter pittii TaxID=48296 RepID=UPI00192CAB85|nr:DUF4123 domain-containing protein [Acinetobacter pittii]